IVEGEEGARLGAGVAIGDLDGDGSIDIGIGSTRISQPSTPGEIAIYDGTISGQIDDRSATTTYTGPQGRDAVGYLFADAGDTNGDGITDFTAGAFGYGDEDGGAAFVVYGPRAGAVSLADADVVVTGDGAGGLGFGLAALGDVDGDGLADVGLGAYEYGGAGDWTGRAYVLPGGRTGSLQADDLDVQASGENQFDMFGSALAGGDVDGDGQDDLLVSAPANPNFSYAPGQVYVFLGPLSGPLDAAADAHWVIQGEGSGQGFGKGLSVADLDGDGQQELIVGAPDSPDGGLGSGKTYLLSTLLLEP
ncbi:MAG: hypothetical protein GXP62_15130, partial [Oligoflexia bacterium]|nr:hypothetical protein [Oligoflexia bacterium]